MIIGGSLCSSTFCRRCGDPKGLFTGKVPERNTVWSWCRRCRGYWESPLVVKSVQLVKPITG